MPSQRFHFAVSLDPFLRWMEKDIEATGKGTVQGCADDIGAALGALQHLVFIEPMFRAARLAAGLTLKPSKCVIVKVRSARCPLVKSVAASARRSVDLWFAGVDF